MTVPRKTWSTPVKTETSAPIPCALCGGEFFKPALRCEGFSYVRCSRCGLVQMNPQPLAAAVRDRYGETYLRYETTNEAAFLRLQELALEDAGFYRLERDLFRRAATGGGPEKPRVLDIGCATGALLAALAKKGWDPLGIEIAAPQAAYARRERKLPVLDFPLEENRLPPDSFDVVLASHLIEHLNDPGGFAAEVQRVLRPGGRFFVTTPNIAGFQARLFRGRWRSAIFDHLYLFSIKTLSALLRDRGFCIEQIVTWGGLAAGTVPAPLKQLADRWAKRHGFGDVMLIRALKPAAPGPAAERPA
jgi:2-polyprenyl-3-methyl-5-hydroxy-6-metoxy-1,4-benzoquinol methylase